MSLCSNSNFDSLLSVLLIWVLCDSTVYSDRIENSTFYEFFLLLYGMTGVLRYRFIHSAIISYRVILSSLPVLPYSSSSFRSSFLALFATFVSTTPSSVSDSDSVDIVFPSCSFSSSQEWPSMQSSQNTFPQ